MVGVCDDADASVVDAKVAKVSAALGVAVEVSVSTVSVWLVVVCFRLFSLSWKRKMAWASKFYQFFGVHRNSSV